MACHLTVTITHASLHSNHPKLVNVNVESSGGDVCSRRLLPFVAPVELQLQLYDELQQVCRLRLTDASSAGNSCQQRPCGCVDLPLANVQLCPDGAACSIEAPVMNDPISDGGCLGWVHAQVQLRSGAKAWCTVPDACSKQCAGEARNDSLLERMELESGDDEHMSILSSQLDFFAAVHTACIRYVPFAICRLMTRSRCWHCFGHF